MADLRSENVQRVANFKQDHGGISDLLDSDMCRKNKNKAHEESFPSEEFAMICTPDLAFARRTPGLCLPTPIAQTGHLEKVKCSTSPNCIHSTITNDA
jgi:hypothetical protein